MTISPYFIAIIAGWVVAQGAKYVIIMASGRKFDHLRQLYLSGNMPSAHSATTVSLATCIGLVEGFESSVFALASLLAGVVMYDAMVLRRSVGEQGASLTQVLADKRFSAVRKPRVAKGHEPLEVLVGALLGTVIGAVVYFVTI